MAGNNLDAETKRDAEKKRESEMKETKIVIVRNEEMSWGGIRVFFARRNYQAVCKRS